MRKDQAVISIFLRYFILLIVGLIVSFTSFFYKVLLPLTIYPVNALLSLSYNTIVTGNIIQIGTIAIEIIPACVAVSAYFLLLILNLTTPMSSKKRLYSLIFSLSTLLLINIIRIFILSLLLINRSINFELIHMVLWYGLSIIIVVGIWFLTAWAFKIEKIPVYSDIKLLIGS